jgi:hypothetical protein
MPRVRRQGRISIISVDVPTVLRRGRAMTTARQQASADLIAELNAELRTRDPMRIMKQQIRLKTLEEVRQRLSEQRVTPGETAFDIYPHVDGIIEELGRLAPA